MSSSDSEASLSDTSLNDTYNDEDAEPVDCVILSDDIVEVAILICPGCNHTEFPGCSDHHLLRAPITFKEGDPDLLIHPPDGWPVKPTPYILPAVACIECQGTSTAESYPWGHACRFCNSVQAYAFCIRMRHSVKQMYKNLCAPSTTSAPGGLVYCEMCHSATPLLRDSPEGGAFPLETFVAGTNAAATKRAWPLVTLAARKLEHFSPLCAFAERVAVLPITYVADENEYMLQHDSGHHSVEAAEVEHLLEQDPTTKVGDDEITTANKVGMHWGSQRLLAAARLTPAAALLPPLKR